MVRTTNSAGLSGAKPTRMFTTPRLISFWVVVSLSHLTKYASRGVWKAPAGTDATLNGVLDLALPVNDLENGQVNPLGVNVLRSFPAYGRVIWGARTRKGADAQADEYKYIPVRRLALFLEESLYRGTQWVVFEPNDEPLWAQIRLNLGAFMHGLFRGTKWVVFEPNDEPLWAQIRLNVGAFMHNLYRQGAFQGTTPREAYFVKCDKETTTQTDSSSAGVGPAT